MREHASAAASALVERDADEVRMQRAVAFLEDNAERTLRELNRVPKKNA